ncbi:MAG: bifunctional fucokinase/L-fucose-1-P-guanylyltransferase [Prevotella sp.]|nr:bifunctional fucokinase/L-fucose-1-P-guanylyltransferase [Prevotella sp.]
MKKLLSLPPNLVECFHDVTGLSRDEFFCTNDPVGHRLGSGGGTTWLLQQAEDWLQGDCNATLSKRERCIILHAGGQSRRLPAYAPSGKILTPIPVFRWERGQKLSQTLLDLQLPLYERIMEQAPARLTTMIVSGDVYIRAAERLGPVPDADVVCYGLWLDASVAKNHGVFVSDRRTPSVLKQMLQKPTTEQLTELLKDHFYLTDIGIWLLSDRAVQLLKQRSTVSGGSAVGTSSLLKEYDLYSEFGCTLGTHPTIDDPELRQLSVAIVPLPGGAFYHFGTSGEMISSTVAIQNVVNDQRDIMHHDRKPHPSIFTQNALTHYRFEAQNTNVWIENSCIGPHWTLTHDNIVTGVPENDWHLTLQPGQCLDIIPVGERQYCIRPYRIDDRFAGSEQQKKQFPVVEHLESLGNLESLESLGNLGSPDDPKSPVVGYLSAEEISNVANLRRLFDQRRRFRAQNWPALARNWQHSVFYQLDLDDAAREFREMQLPMPEPVAETAPLMTRIHDAMFRGDSQAAFALLGEGLTERALQVRQSPRLSVYPDQIVWGRSPVRIDLAGGWTDTPPYCLMEGGAVVNIAIELNGQPPLQTYVKPCREPHIVLRSIDLGAMEVIETYEQLAAYNKVGSPFSIPKAALALAGFLPVFSQDSYPTLRAQLEAFGCGIELTLLSAIPAGSGLGTSSILASTVLGAVSDFCSLAWDKSEIGRRTLILEQLLTTGGGWQDQFGGVLGGVKLLQTQRGFDQNPMVRWLPDHLYTQPEYQQCHLLYYTGITRTAKTILAEIVRRMFLNHGGELRQLREMRAHAMDMYEAIQRQDFQEMGRLIRKTWQQNQLIDSGTNPDSVRRITCLVDDLCLGYKLPGAGGGGYLYMVAKDPEAAAHIKQIINAAQPNANARFVDMTLSRTGLQVSRS